LIQTSTRKQDASGGDPIRHLYLHIPFCHRICPYCSFYKHTPGEIGAGRFLDAVLLETQRLVAQFGSRLALETIYWGGGTPSLLSTEHLQQFMPRWLEMLHLEHLQEWTVEMNPMTLTLEKLHVLRHHGVTRASLGVQAWDAATLATLGRDHSPDQARQAFQLLRQADFAHVSLDLMFSVPGQSQEAWQHSLDATVALAPDHISCYNLTYEEDTAFFQSLMDGTFTHQETTDVAHFDQARHLLEKLGYTHYETSNYARPGACSLHNQAYWRGAHYLGLGPGAVGTVDRIRSKNIANTRLYVELLEQGQCPATEQETLTDSQWQCERIALLLRTAEGLPMQYVSGAAGLVETLCAEHLAYCEAGHLILSSRGRALVDSIAEQLWLAL
jgi:oxygen-independent coproporphyrinogen-3 oxidase